MEELHLRIRSGRGAKVHQSVRVRRQPGGCEYWRVCASVAPCDDEGVVLDPTLEQLRNMSVPWLPVSVRELCKARRKQTAAAETAAGK